MAKTAAKKPKRKRPDPSPNGALGLLIDALGQVRDDIATMQDGERRLARAARKAIAGRKGPAAGKEFLAVLDDVETIRLAFEPVRREAAKRGIALEVLLRPDTAACRKVLGDKTVQRIGTPHHSRRLRVERIKPAAARRAKK